MPTNISVETQFDHDFSRVAVQPLTPGFGQNSSNVACPLLPMRCPFGGACHTCPPRVQAKLTIGQPGDKYEQEADRIAEQVIAMPTNSRVSGVPTIFQHLTAEPSGQTDPVPVSVDRALATPGRPLEPALRQDMELRFGFDFSQVRVHTGTAVEQSTREVNAHAYTVGPNIVFDKDQYSPITDQGRHLIAHELTHVVQQSRPKDIFFAQSKESHCLSSSSKKDFFKSIDPKVELDVIRSMREQQAIAGWPLETLNPIVPHVLQRYEVEEDAPTSSTLETAEQPMSRPEEVAFSRTSPGRIEVAVQPVMISLHNFAINSANLKALHRGALRELNSLVHRAGPQNLRFVILGHTDSSGTPRVNQLLSERRARRVQRILGRAGVTNFRVAGFGENVPVVSNDSVDGRSRNRRVDIHILPVGPSPSTRSRGEGTRPRTVPTEPTRPERPSAEPPSSPVGPPERPPHETHDDESWFCAEHPILCAAITAVAGAVAAALWYCLRNPLSCIPTSPTPAGPGSGPQQTPSPHPCPLVVDLPSGILPATGDRKPGGEGIYWVACRGGRGFDMRIVFLDDPATGCDCSLGEYMQKVRGFAERTSPGGIPQQDQISVVGSLMSTTDYREDARQFGTMPYGHRNQPQFDGDEFLPLRNTGCVYLGFDNPNMTGGDTPGERMRFHLEFQGAPVDRRNRSLPLQPWREWTVDGDFTIPQPTPTRRPPPSTGPTPGPTPAPTPPTSPSPFVPPYQGPTIGPAPSPSVPAVFCLGGAIGCETLEFLRRRQREHTFLTEQDVNEAVEIEHRLLSQTRWGAPTFDPESYWRRVGDLRQQARQRIYDFARIHFMPFPD